MIDDAQLHAVRNTGATKRSIVLCDVRRTDVPRIPPGTELQDIPRFLAKAQR